MGHKIAHYPFTVEMDFIFVNNINIYTQSLTQKQSKATFYVKLWLSLHINIFHKNKIHSYFSNFA